MKEIATLIMVGVSCIISLFDEPSSEIDDVNDISHIVDNAQFYPKGYVDTFKLHPMHFEKYKEKFYSYYKHTTKAPQKERYFVNFSAPK